MLRVIGEILAFEPQSRGTDLAAGARLPRQGRAPAVGRVPRVGLPERRLGARAADRARSATRSCRSSSRDPLEAALPDVGLLVLEDLETGEVVEVDTQRRGARRASRSARGEPPTARDAALRRLNLDVVNVSDRPAVRRRADRVLPRAREADGARMRRARASCSRAASRAPASAARPRQPRTVDASCRSTLGAPEVQRGGEPDRGPARRTVHAVRHRGVRATASRSTCASRSSSAGVRGRRKDASRRPVRADGKHDARVAARGHRVGPRRPAGAAGRGDVHRRRPRRPGRDQRRCRSRVTGVLGDSSTIRS